MVKEDETRSFKVCTPVVYTYFFWMAAPRLCPIKLIPKCYASAPDQPHHPSLIEIRTSMDPSFRTVLIPLLRRWFVDKGLVPSKKQISAKTQHYAAQQPLLAHFFHASCEKPSFGPEISLSVNNSHVYCNNRNHHHLNFRSNCHKCR